MVASAPAFTALRAGADAPFDRDHDRLLTRSLARHPGAARPLAPAGAPRAA